MKTWVLLLAVILSVGCEPVEPKARPLFQYNIKRIVRDQADVFVIYYETSPGVVQCRRWCVYTFTTDVSKGEPNYIVVDGDEVKSIHLHSVAEIEEVKITH